MVMWGWSGFLGMVKALNCFLLRWLALLSVAHRPVGINHCFRHTLGQGNETAAQICSGRRQNYTGQVLGLTIWFAIFVNLVFGIFSRYCLFNSV